MYFGQRFHTPMKLQKKCIQFLNENLQIFHISDIDLLFVFCTHQFLLVLLLWLASISWLYLK